MLVRGKLFYIDKQLFDKRWEEYCDKLRVDPIEYDVIEFKVLFAEPLDGEVVIPKQINTTGFTDVVHKTITLHRDGIIKDLWYSYVCEFLGISPETTAVKLNVREIRGMRSEW